EVNLKPPRVPYQETVRKAAKAHGRHNKQTGGRGQFGDCHIEIEPLEHGTGFEFVNAIKGGVIPTGFIPAVQKGVIEAMQDGVVAGYPVKDVRVRLYDGSYHTVDSSEMAFKVAGSLAMKQALEQAGPVLLEPIMQVTVSVPEDAVGDVIGDLNSRRGRPLGMEPVGAGMTEVKAEVPMSEMLSYAPDLRSITGGQGEFTMEFVRYEEVPGHLASKIVDEARAEGTRPPQDGGERGSDGRRSLFGRPRRRRGASPHPADEPLPAEELEPRSWSRRPRWAQEPVREQEPPREPRHVRAVPTSPEQKVASAIHLFNGSEHPRTVAGVARSLGAPT